VHLAEDGLGPQRSPSDPHRVAWSLLKLRWCPIPGFLRTPPGPLPWERGLVPWGCHRWSNFFHQTKKLANIETSNQSNPTLEKVMIYCSIRLFLGCFWLNDIECNGAREMSSHWAWGPPSCRSLPPFLHAWRLKKIPVSPDDHLTLGTFHFGKLRNLGKPIPGFFSTWNSPGFFLKFWRFQPSSCEVTTKIHGRWNLQVDMTRLWKVTPWGLHLPQPGRDWSPKRWSIRFRHCQVINIPLKELRFLGCDFWRKKKLVIFATKMY